MKKFIIRSAVGTGRQDMDILIPVPEMVMVELFDARLRPHLNDADAAWLQKRCAAI